MGDNNCKDKRETINKKVMGISGKEKQINGLNALKQGERNLLKINIRRLRI
ncbi:hypothetical protein OVS_00760 [Mycoplasma ovis str. Michigan]|uniref:Transposase n=1 Tax=Mycoplasma ovis str. Michigan TaxID=1415773 RepID=A0ABN4BQP3_9MOLU|nr:hypothetical protein [Mycoplasma ovis]AHC40142.1 hypothetical protein OVS_00760 [Mycoplasma ovis str. Michigan]